MDSLRFSILCYAQCFCVHLDRLCPVAFSENIVSFSEKIPNKIPNENLWILKIHNGTIVSLFAADANTRENLIVFHFLPCTGRHFQEMEGWIYKNKKSVSAKNYFSQFRFLQRCTTTTSSLHINAYLISKQ